MNHPMNRSHARVTNARTHYRITVSLHFAQEPSKEQRDALKTKRKELGNPETEMACWLLEALAQDADGDYVKNIMYRRNTLETLAK